MICLDKMVNEHEYKTACDAGSDNGPDTEIVEQEKNMIVQLSLAIQQFSIIIGRL